jgi:hypothetical protein
MPPVPLHSGDVLKFTPSCLKDMAIPPVFTLKAPKRLDRENFEFLCIEENLRSYSTEDIRKEMVKALESGWDQEAADRWIPVLKAFWEAVDQYADDNKGKATEEREDFVFEPCSIEDISALSEAVVDYWSPLRKMTAANARWQEYSPWIIVRIVLASVEGFDVKLTREGGVLTMESIRDIRDAFDAMAKADENCPAVLPFLELSTECASRMFLTGEQEKNSQSPAPSSPTPPPLKTGTELQVGASTEQATSKKTPETS